MNTVKKITLGIVFLCFIIFAFQNRDETTVEFFSASLTLPTSLMLVVVYALGMLTGGILISMFRKLLNWENENQNNEKSA